MQQFRQWWQVNVDVKQQRDAYFATRENITWNINAHDNRTPIYSDNPYWTFYENFETDTRSRFYGNVVLNYEVNDWLDIMGRFTYDSYNELQEERTNVGSSNVPLYTRFNNSVAEYNYDIFANFNKNLTEKLNVEGSIGANLSRKDWSSIYALTNGGLNIAGLYSLSNSASPINAPTEYDAIQMVDGVFGRASFGYDNTAYVEGTFRRDRNSSLPIAANAYNYWSITGSLIFSQLIEADWLNFGKLRANYGTVGNGTTPYQVFNTYGITAPFGGAANASNPTSKKNPDLVPEEQANWEVGLEMKLFDNRLGFDVTYYNTENRNQIVEVPVTRSTGYAQILLNAGTIENKGVELQLNAVPIRTEDFEWNLTLNWDRNRNKVLSLLDGIEALELDNFQTGLTVNAVVGEPYGTIRGRDFVYHANGQRVIATNGRIARTSTSNNNIGDINPDWKAGLYNNFSYKNWNLSFLIDMQKGGDVFLLDTYYGFGTGLYDFTAGNNELGNPYRDPVTAGADSGGILFEGVQADGTPNTVRADATTAGTWGYRQPQANHVYDAGYIKLREASISYKFDDKMLSKLPFTAATISVIGRNLWIMDKSTPYADPEAGLSSGNAQGNQSGSYPAIREIGASVKLQF